MRRLHLGMTVQTPDPVILIVDGDKQDVRLAAIAYLSADFRDRPSEFRDRPSENE